MSKSERKAKSPWQRHNKVKFLYSNQYHAWKNNPNPFTAANHRKFVESKFGPLARSKPMNYREEEVNNEFAEAAE